MQTRNKILVQSRNVVKKFGSLTVLDDFSLDVHQQEAVVLCGPSGAGKSTFIRCINGLESIQSGSIEVDGVAVNPKTAKTIRESIGMVFQSFALFPHLTALENVVLAPTRVLKRPRSEVVANASALFATVGLSDKLNSYPRQLSGGQQQRVAIVRGLIMNPKAMLFDEPTSALDAEMIKDVLDVIRNLKDQGMTMIIVSHELGFVRQVADLVVFMDGGKLVEAADPVRFFEAPTQERTKHFLAQILNP